MTDDPRTPGDRPDLSAVERAATMRSASRANGASWWPSARSPTSTTSSAITTSGIPSSVSCRAGEYVLIAGRPYTREELTAEWALAQFPPQL